MMARAVASRWMINKSSLTSLGLRSYVSVSNSRQHNYHEEPEIDLDYNGNATTNAGGKLYSSHEPTNALQKLLLTVGSASAALLDPRRDDMVAVLGETTGDSALQYIRSRMLESEEGRLILKEKPVINTQDLRFDHLRSLPPGTVAHEYITFMDKYGLSPDARLPVMFVDDPELAYVMRRYRETHDLVHAIHRMPTNMLGEVAVKWIEGIQFRLPMCVGGAVFGALRFKPKQRQKYLTKYLPWAIRAGKEAEFLMSVYWEKHWEDNADELRRRLNIKLLDL